MACVPDVPHPCPKPSSPPELSLVDLMCPGFTTCPLRTTAPWANDHMQLQNALSQFCEGFTSHCWIIQFLPSLIRRQQKASLVKTDFNSSPLFLCAKLLKQTKKHNFESYTSPQPASIAYVAPNLGAPPSRTAPLSRLLVPAKLNPVTVAPDPLLKTRRGCALGVGAAGQCAWLGTWKAVYSQGSVAGPPSRLLDWPTLACRLCGLLERMSAASLQRVERFRMAAAAAMWVSSLHWP